MKSYRYTVDDAVLQVFSGATKQYRVELLRTFAYLAENPFLEGESTQPDHTGRGCQVKRFGPWVVTFWPEHLASVVHIVDVERLF